MRKNYSNLIRNAQSRQNPEGLILEKSFSDELGSISYSDALIYLKTTMKGVEPEYTRKSKEAGEKVKDHLRTVLTNVIYKYQGSVMTDTHIKGYSDIDLLAICDTFYSWDSIAVHEAVGSYPISQHFNTQEINKLKSEVDCFSSYQGNSLEDLKSIRSKSENKLKDVYLDCDITKVKAIKIFNRSLRRDVDIVTANWYDDVYSILNGRGDYRGVQVYNKLTDSKGSATYPFLSINRINDRSTSTNGRLKRMIRFLKHCKADSAIDIDINSFDINAICYDIEPNSYRMLSYIELVPVLYLQLKSICENDNHSNKLVSVDGHENIFIDNPQKRQNLKLLLNEVESIYLDLHESRLLAS
jgi:hypothetical protein